MVQNFNVMPPDTSQGIYTVLFLDSKHVKYVCKVVNTH